MSEVPYAVICRGCKEGSTERLKTLLMETLSKIAEEGIDPKQIEGAIHQLEFSRLEITGDYGPFGLTLFMRSVLTMQHGHPPEEALTVYSQFKRLQLLAKDPNYFPSLIRKYLIENPHFVTHTFVPNSKLEKQEIEEEKKRLKEIEKELTEEDKETIRKQAKALEAYQEKAEAGSLECLPKIDLTDVPKEVQDFSLDHEQVGQVTAFHHTCFTNQIVYARLLFDLPAMPLEDIAPLQLLLSLLPELGAGDRDYLEYINAHLGDFGTSLNLYPQVGKGNELKPAFGFKGKALNRNVDKLFSLFLDICRAPDLKDLKRIKELILQIHTSLENRLNRSAMSYAIQRSVSTFTTTSMIGEHLSGLNYFQFIRELSKDLDGKLPKLVETFERLKEALYHFTIPHLILSCDESQYHTLTKEKFYGLADLPATPFKDWGELPPSGTSPQEAFSISSPVAFSASGILATPLSPALSVSTELLENTFLHKKVREQGGAYGAGVNYNPITGNYTLYGFRDPHIRLTFEAFKEGIERIAAGKFTERELTEAKLGVIQDADTPISPGSRASAGYSYFREGYSKEMRQTFRDHLLSLTKEEVKEAVSEYLKGAEASRVTFAGAPLLANENPGLSITEI